MNIDPVKVVVVDDVSDSAETLAELLRLDGYSVWTASNGADALELIAQQRPHCVLYDIVMPGIGGDELSVRLRKLYGDDIVLIAVTGFDDRDARVAQTFSLADHYLLKPIDADALRRVLLPLR